MGEVVLSIASIGARAEEIKTNSAEFLWLCRGIKPPMLPNKPVARDLRPVKRRHAWGTTEMNNFRSIKNGIFDEILPPKAAPDRVGLISAGNPNVLREAAGLADYANPRKRRRGGRVKIVGVRPKHRLDRPSRRKFDSGGAADSDPPAASPGDTPRSGVDALLAIPKIRAIAAGLAGIQKVDQAISKETGTKPAYRRGGSARR